MVAVEQESGEVAGLAIAHRVVLPAVAGIAAHQQGAVAAAGPRASLRVALLMLPLAALLLAWGLFGDASLALYAGRLFLGLGLVCGLDFLIADPGKYRPDEEVAAWMSRDPIVIYRERLIGEGFDVAVLDDIEEAGMAEIDAATAAVRNAPPPHPDTMMTQVWADGGSAWRN